MARLQGKVAIVTGAAGGIGSAICRHFVREGATVIGVDLHRDTLESVATSVRGAGSHGASVSAGGGRMAAIAADVADEATAKAAVLRARGEFGRLDVLVCTAVCDLPLAPLTTLSLADWRRTFAV